jgi:hypothetical protein
VILPIFGLLAFGYAATFTRVFGEAAATAILLSSILSVATLAAVLVWLDAGQD